MDGAEFIWVENKKYITCRKTVFDKSEIRNFRMCAFKKKYDFDKKIKTLSLNIFADTKYFLYINGSYMGFGPVCSGGDYASTEAMPVQYYSSYDLSVDEEFIDIFVLVQIDAAVQTDTSVGRGGLVIKGSVTFEDGSAFDIATDESWLASPAFCYPELNLYDYTKKPYAWKNAVKTENIWNLKISQIPLLTQTKVTDESFLPIITAANSEKEVFLEFDKIYSGFLYMDVSAQGRFEITAYLGETAGRPLQVETIKGSGSVRHNSVIMTSAGVLRLKIKNFCDMPLIVQEAAILYTRYPESGENGSFVCSDEELNKIYELGRHTLNICRQSIHLDSPAHQENLGCAGDYFIESLIEYFTYQDTRLIRFDIIRIADYLKMSSGYMFHTTYSLIWIQMVYDYYMHSGDIWAVEYCSGAIGAVLDKMESYSDETMLISNPPSYMFVDWVWRGEYNMHHPPKAMGQAVLNAFYYNALGAATKIYTYLGKTEEAAALHVKRLTVKTAFNRAFFDAERNLYFDGLNDETKNVSEFMPRNVQGRYFSKYTNTLAVLFKLCDEKNAADLLKRALYYEELDDVQPYFMHFVLEALYSAGLFEQFGIKEIKRWNSFVNECDKGMKEAWIIFDGYSFDYSHAWSATPTYQLPSKIGGIEIIEPGMRKVKVNPNLFGIKEAKIKIPTPYGTIDIEFKDEPVITAPKEIEIII